MQKTKMQLVRLKTNDPHHRVQVISRPDWSGGGTHEIIAELEVGDRVVERVRHWKNGRLTAEEQAAIQEARIFARKLSNIEVLIWRDGIEEGGN